MPYRHRSTPPIWPRSRRPVTSDNVTAQKAAIAASTGPVFAYCASGNRSSVVWALAHAGERPADELIGIPAQFGYNLEHLRPMLAAKG